MKRPCSDLMSEYRKALRTIDKKVRIDTLAAIISKMRLTIDSLPVDGKKREWELIWHQLMSGRSKRGTLNAMNAMHADPRTDTKDTGLTWCYLCRPRGARLTNFYSG